MNRTELKSHEIRALRFLRDHGPDTIGVVDTDDKMAAAFVFVQLHDRDLVTAPYGLSGPVSISPAGFAALAEVPQ